MKKSEPTGDGDREVLVALDGRRADKSMREITEELYGAERVAAEGDADSRARLRARLSLQKARAHDKWG